MELPAGFELQCDENSQGAEEEEGGADEDVPPPVLMGLL